MGILSSDEARAVLTTMSPTMVRSLRVLRQHPEVSLHGRERSALQFRELIELDGYGSLIITDLGTDVLNLIEEKETP